MDLRHRHPESVAPQLTAKVDAASWLVVINHREAFIYRSLAAGALPQLIRSQASGDFFRPASHAKEDSRRQEIPGPHDYFEPVAAVLNGAGRILISSGGAGTASGMDQFVAWLKVHRPAVAERVIGALVVDSMHQTDDQLLAQAREFFANTDCKETGSSGGS